MLALDITPVILSKVNEDRDVRPVEFDHDAHRDRSIGERLSGWSSECGRMFSRYEKTTKTSTGMNRMAFIW